MKTLFISDYSYSEIQGGTECNDDIMINHLNCDFIKSSFFTSGKGYDKFIVSNFFEMPEEGKKWLIDNGRFQIFEHDYKLFPNRIPSEYPEFRMPKEDIRNVEFYRAAEKVVFQTSYQKHIFDLNLDIPKSLIFNANLWTEERLDFFQNAWGAKNGRALIMSSENSIKNTAGAVEIAEFYKIPFDLCPKMSEDDFIYTLGKYSALILPCAIPESFNRVALEMRMLGGVVITNDFCAVAHEKFYSWDRLAIIKHMRDKKEWLLRNLGEWCDN